MVVVVVDGVTADGGVGVVDDGGACGACGGAAETTVGGKIDGGGVCRCARLRKLAGLKFK